MDKSFAGAALSAPAKVFKCGLLLFLGFVNDATTFAESNGGGGCSQSDLPWRDRDEEDAAYMRRCMFCAQKMASVVPLIVGSYQNATWDFTLYSEGLLTVEDRGIGYRLMRLISLKRAEGQDPVSAS